MEKTENEMNAGMMLGFWALGNLCNLFCARCTVGLH